METISQRQSATLAQIALAWLLDQGDHMVPTLGTKRRHDLEENVRAPQLKLFEQEISTLSRTFAPRITSGARYNEHRMNLTDR